MTDPDKREHSTIGTIALVVVAGLLTAAIAGNFAFVVDTREDVVRLETELDAVKDKTSKVDNLPAQISVLQAQVTRVERDIAEIKSSLEKRGR